MAGQEKFKPANKANGYEIPEHEGHLVHVLLETKTFNSTTGEKISEPRPQSFYPAEFDRMEADGHFKGMSVEILHDPRSAKEQTAGKINTAMETPLQNLNVSKPLDKMTKQELMIKYAELYKDTAEDPTVLSEAELRDAITEKIEFLRGEEAAARLNDKGVSEDDGSGKGAAVAGTNGPVTTGTAKAGKKTDTENTGK